MSRRRRPRTTGPEPRSFAAYDEEAVQRIADSISEAIFGQSTGIDVADLDLAIGSGSSTTDTELTDALMTAIEANDPAEIRLLLSRDGSLTPLEIDQVLAALSQRRT